MANNHQGAASTARKIIDSAYDIIIFLITLPLVGITTLGLIKASTVVANRYQWLLADQQSTSLWATFTNRPKQIELSDQTVIMIAIVALCLHAAHSILPKPGTTLRSRARRSTWESVAVFLLVCGAMLSTTLVADPFALVLKVMGWIEPVLGRLFWE